MKPRVLSLCGVITFLEMSADAWWRHLMEAFSALLALCAGNSPVPVNSPHKGQWRGALVFSFICAWINDWVNNREADDLRRHRGHYDVIVMEKDKAHNWIFSTHGDSDRDLVKRRQQCSRQPVPNIFSSYCWPIAVSLRTVAKHNHQSVSN